jgi:hypothetical protein
MSHIIMDARVIKSNLRVRNPDRFWYNIPYACLSSLSTKQPCSPPSFPPDHFRPGRRVCPVPGAGGRIQPAVYWENLPRSISRWRFPGRPYAGGCRRPTGGAVHLPQYWQDCLPGRLAGMDRYPSRIGSQPGCPIQRPGSLPVGAQRRPAHSPVGSLCCLAWRSLFIARDALQ